jgi:hypothetical protein
VRRQGWCRRRGGGGGRRRGGECKDRSGSDTESRGYVLPALNRNTPARSRQSTDLDAPVRIPDDSDCPDSSPVLGPGPPILRHGGPAAPGKGRRDSTCSPSPWRSLWTTRTEALSRHASVRAGPCTGLVTGSRGRKPVGLLHGIEAHPAVACGNRRMPSTSVTRTSTSTARMNTTRTDGPTSTGRLGRRR